VEGTVVETITPSPLDVRLDIAVRYLGEEGGRAFVASMEHESVLFVIRPDRWITADFSGEL
ncbi:MAG TPA: pyridoxamine 5-phosphate oxidase, partial [Mycobacterium sp.]